MEKTKEQAVYQLTVTEKQVRLINEALEEYFRLGMNQWGLLSERLSLIGVDMSPDNPYHEKIFDRFIQKRDDVLIVMESAGRILWPCWPSGLTKEDTNNLIAQDIWQAIRYQLWLNEQDRNQFGYCVDENKPLFLSNELIARCVKCGKISQGEG